MSAPKLWRPGLSLAEIEREAVLAALEYFAGDKVRTARELGVTLRTLQRRIRDWDLVEFQREPGRPKRHSTGKE